jgi:formate-dependent nitrite reductase membrane component NrfD
VIAAAAGLSGGDPDLARDARWLAFAGAGLSPMLLVADLGRPARFLNMLRVFKRQSAMSIGAWTLVAFSAMVTIAVLMRITGVAGAAPIVAAGVDLLAASLGLVLSTYSGVLLGVTAVPVWARHATRLPMLFAASALGAAISILELAGHMSGVTNAIGIGAALGELAVVITIATARDRASLPLRHSRIALMIGAADGLGAGVPLILRLAAEHSTPARTAAAVTTIAGSLLLRYGWMAAGRVSTADPVAALKPGASR